MEFERLRPEFEAAGYAIAGCSTDAAEFNKDFAEEHAFQYPLISNGGDVVAQFGACRQPTCASARRATVVIGADGAVRRFEDPFDARSGPAALLAALTGKAVPAPPAPRGGGRGGNLRSRHRSRPTAHDAAHHSGEHR